MTDDWLEKARRAARDVGEARPVDAARTRAKVARTVARRARGRWRAPWIGLAAAALVGGTAWASGAEGARLVAWLRSDVSAAARSGGATSTSPAPIHAPPQAPASVPPEPEAPSAAAADALNPPARTFPPSGLPVPKKTVGPVETTLPPRRRDRGHGVEAANAAAPLYAEAHALHFVERDTVRALAAWDRYLAVAPDDARAGLALEARYNRAICLVRLGRREAAREALAPFASGAYGSYRQDEARSLLDAPVLRAPGASDSDSTP
jgi:hypothetical protein